MPLTAEKKAQMDALLAQGGTSQPSLTPERKAQMDAVISASRPEPAPEYGLPEKALRVSSDLFIGAAKGAASTLAEASVLGEKLLLNPIDRLMGRDTSKMGVPLGQQVLDSGKLEAVGTAQKIGKTAEQIGEFFIPGGAAGKGAKVAETALKLAPKAGTGFLKGMAKAAGRAAVRGTAEGAVATGVRMVQTGGDVRKSAEAGIGAAVGTAALSPAFDAASAVYGLIKPEASKAFVRGIGAVGNRASEYNETTARTALADIVGQAKREGKDLARSEDPFKDAIAVTRNAKKWVWNQYARLKGAAPGIIDGNKIADAMEGSVAARTRVQEPALYDRIKTIADTYRRNLTVDEAEDFLQGTNAELTSYYARNKVGRSEALGNPETAFKVREAEALRDALYAKIEELTGKSAGDLKKRYGALTDTMDRLYHRKSVQDRISPVSLAEQISYPMAVGKGALGLLTKNPVAAAEGVAQAVTSREIKEMVSRESMLRRAFSKAEKHGIKAPEEVFPVKQKIAGLLPAPAIRAPAAASVTPEFKEPAMESRLRSLEAAVGGRKQAGFLGIDETSRVIRNSKGQFFVALGNRTPTRISSREAYELEKAGYPISSGSK